MIEKIILIDNQYFDQKVPRNTNNKIHLMLNQYIQYSIFLKNFQRI